MSGVTADTDELQVFAVDLATASAAVAVKVQPVISKGALNIKTTMQAEATASGSFRQIARTISYDIRADSAGVEAEIGPDRDRGGSASLLGAYYGWPAGGGATLPDPVLALEAEAEAVIKFLTELVEDIP